MKEKELIFIVEDSDEGGYTAKALEHAIFTEAESIDELKNNIKEAVKCHFEENDLPLLIKLHYTKDEVMSV